MSATFTTTTSDVLFVDEQGDVTFSPQSSPVTFTAAVAGPQGATGQGVPAGGSTGYVLTKSSGADYATTWSPASGGVTAHGDLTGLDLDHHSAYALSLDVAFLAGGSTLTGSPGIVIVTSGGTLTFPATVPAADYGREWRIVNLSGGSITLDAGTSGLLFSGASQTLTLGAGRLVSILALSAAGIGSLWGIQLLEPAGAVGGAIGATDVLAGTGITATPAIDGSSVTIGVGSLAASTITSGTLNVARLPVGTTSSTVAAGDDARLARPPGLFVSAQYSASASASQGNAGLTSNRLYYSPLYVPRPVTIGRIAIHHTANAAGAGSVARLGIYTSAGDLPSSLVLDAGTVDLSTAAAFKEIVLGASSVALSPGLYWLAAVAQVTSGSPTFLSGVPTMTVTDQVSTFTGTKFEAGVSGSLPATATPGTGNTTQPPVIFVRTV